MLSKFVIILFVLFGFSLIFLIFRGEKEKKAISEPETRAEKKRRRMRTISSKRISNEKAWKLIRKARIFGIKENDSKIICD